MKKAFISLPKIELHCHLDGSLSSDFIRKYAPENQSINILSEAELKAKLSAPKNCASLAEYLTRFDIPISCLQQKASITAAVLDVLSQAATENVAYMEIRFAPTFSTNEGLSYRDILEAAVEGCTKGHALYNIKSNIIACAMRHLDEATNLKTLYEAREFLGNGVCALDLAGDEAAFDNTKFIYLFEEAKKLDMPMTIHSGECGSKANIKLAVEAGAKRIGHGIAMGNDAQLLELCKLNNVGIEMCPTSNYQTNAVKPGESYPLRTFVDNSILATINTDNRTVSQTTMTEELALTVDSLNIKEGEISGILKNAIHVSFADIDTKNELIKML